MKTIWGGRFKKPMDPRVIAFTESISFDVRLGLFDIEGSLAHVKTLVKAKLLTAQEGNKLIKGLQKVGTLIQKGKFPTNTSMEDIHTAVEKALIKLVGPLGGKLHTGRSRNDQIATDARLYLRSAILKTVTTGTRFLEVLCRISLKEKNTVMPGYTHLQRAMPIVLGHHLAAYAFMIARDMDRFLTVWDRANALPLGSGALAGTNHDFDRFYTAKNLGLKSAIANSLDAVSDRDVFVDYLSAAAIIQMHLSRFSEDLILWASTEFGFIEMDDAFATGSSLMPQKKNPDVAELVRGKTGRVYGNLIGLLTVLKGLPLAYNRDLQEDKHFLFDSVDTVNGSLEVLTGFLSTLTFNRSRMAEFADKDLTLLATDLADVLVKAGVPFRESHEVIGGVVQYCLKNGKRLQDLTDNELRGFSDKFPKNTAANLSVQSSVSQKKTFGGTSPDNVVGQIALLKSKIVQYKKLIKKL
jgi:argininosuccinate lyase